MAKITALTAAAGVPYDDARKVAADILSNWAMLYVRAKTQFDIDTAIFHAWVAISEAIDRAMLAASPAAPAPADAKARPEEDYHEDMGNMLWWRFPIDEPPYSGSPLDTDWPGYHTHFTPIPIPIPPRGE